MSFPTRNPRSALESVQRFAHVIRYAIDPSRKDRKQDWVVPIGHWDVMPGTSGLVEAFGIPSRSDSKRCSRALFFAKAGSVVPMHWHDYTEYVLIEHGKGIYTLDGLKQQVSDGDVYFFPARAHHDFLALTDVYAYVWFRKNEVLHML